MSINPTVDFDLGYIHESGHIRTILQNALPQSAWVKLDERNPRFANLLRQVLGGEIKADYPPYMIETCDCGPNKDPSLWMDWDAICAAVCTSLEQIEVQVQKYAQKGTIVTVRDLFPVHSFYLVSRSSFDEYQIDLEKGYQGHELLKQFGIWKNALNSLMDSIANQENNSVEGWVLDQVAVLDWSAALSEGSPFATSQPPLPPDFTDAVWREHYGSTRAGLVMTPAGHLSYSHADDNLTGFEIVTIYGYKMWFIWDSTPDTILKQQMRLSQGLNLKDFDWCLKELGTPSVYITTPGTCFVGNPGYIHAVFSFTPAAHWAIPLVSERMLPRKQELLPLWNAWLEKHKKYITHTKRQQESEPNELGQTVRDIHGCTKLCEDMWQEWEAKQVKQSSIW